ncbi:MAG: dNTP triphosphohydrolase [Cyanobium sp. CZS 48M]|nr:dNTP triphosphohydrolase [Cyanobium sp. CZS48M]
MPSSRTDQRIPEGTFDRTPFEVDRDRVLYSYEFRRLAGVTQAANASEGPNLHNRLTHSLKVAQVGRRLAQYLLKRYPTEVGECGGLDIDVVETACLAHDLGHPPFGHAAESVLNSELAKVDTCLGFEGNAQSFRTVVYRSIRRTSSDGMNLAVATLNAVLKYPWSQADQQGQTKKKWGYYPEESEAFEFARGLVGPNRLHNQTLEAAAMDLADDIAYSVHDVDDFYRAGMIPLDQLICGAGERHRFLEWVSCHSKSSDFGFSVADVLEMGNNYFDSLLRTAKCLVSPFVNTREQLQDLHTLTSLHITRFLGCLDGPVPFEINPAAETQIVRSRWLNFEIMILKLLMQRYVYQDNSLLAQQHGHKRLIAEVFHALRISIGDHGGNGMVPRRFELDAREAKGDQILAARLAADIVCSMDEPQILMFYQRLLGIRPGILAERLIY